VNYHNQSVQNVLNALNTDSVKGISSERAKELQEKFGPNKLKEKKKKSAFV